MKGNSIPTPTVGEILYEEFMEPAGITAYRLAKDIHVPISRIQEILANKRKITVDTSLRLAKYFSLSDRYFLEIQNDIDVRNAKMAMEDDLVTIPVFRFAM
jgi:addiction module HigA family antidote